VLAALVLALLAAVFFIATDWGNGRRTTRDTANSAQRRVIAVEKRVLPIQRVLIQKGIVLHGAHGLRGGPGPAGARGLRGLLGPMGRTGPFGVTGAKGESGSNGTAGTNGAQGPKGDTGPQGPKGATGDTGPQGPKGDTGDTGPPPSGPFKCTASSDPSDPPGTFTCSP
jgi:hypothetical protein